MHVFIFNLVEWIYIYLVILSFTTLFSFNSRSFIRILVLNVGFSCALLTSHWNRSFFIHVFFTGYLILLSRFITATRVFVEDTESRVGAGKLSVQEYRNLFLRLNTELKESSVAVSQRMFRKNVL